MLLPRGRLTPFSARWLTLTLLPASALAASSEPPGLEPVKDPPALGVYGDPGGAAWDGQGLLQANLHPKAQILRMGPDLSLDGAVDLPGEASFGAVTGAALKPGHVFVVAQDADGAWLLFDHAGADQGLQGGRLSAGLPLGPLFGAAAPTLGLPLAAPPAPPEPPAPPAPPEEGAAPAGAAAEPEAPPEPPAPPPPPEVEGLAIGGLSVDAKGALLFGLLSPLRDGKAVVARMTAPEQAFAEGAAAPELEAFAELDLGGEGIVSIELYDETSFLVGSAPTDGSASGSVWWWQPGQKPVPLARFADGRPEGVARAAAYGKMTVFLSQAGTRQARQVFADISPPTPGAQITASPYRILRNPAPRALPSTRPRRLDGVAGVYRISSDADGTVYAFDELLRPVTEKALPRPGDQFKGPAEQPILYPAGVDLTESGDALTVIATHEGLTRKDRKATRSAKLGQARGVVWLPRMEGEAFMAQAAPADSLSKALAGAGLADPDQPVKNPEEAVRIGAVASTPDGLWIVGLERPLGEGGRSILLRTSPDALSGAAPAEKLPLFDPVVNAPPGTGLGPQGVTGLDRLLGPWMLLTTATPEGASLPGGTLWLWNRDDNQVRWVQRWIGYRPMAVARSADPRKALVVLERIQGGSVAARPAYDYVQVIFPPPRPKPRSKPEAAKPAPGSASSPPASGSAPAESAPAAASDSEAR